ncbi:MAG: GIY-YIG nuclease family protein [Magnetococcales bacterium]|nr:GIY-YIG nuclease family protein [Magnetococcales bacterium]
MSTITVGAKGEVTFRPGHYLYLGSARGQWTHRLARHFRADKKQRWHIDYILMAPGVELQQAWIGPDGLECSLAKAFLDQGAYVPHPGLGASDCRCPAHFLMWLDQAHKKAEILTRRECRPLALEELNQANSVLS